MRYSAHYGVWLHTTLYRHNGLFEKFSFLFFVQVKTIAIFSPPAHNNYLIGQCHEIFAHCFLLKRFELATGPHMNRRKRFYELFRFREDIRSQSSKITCLRSLWLCACGQAHFTLDMDVFILLNYCYWVCIHTHVPFLPDCTFKICEKPSKFYENVWVVLSVST